MTRSPARPGWACPARYATPRTPGRPSYGQAIAAVAAALGNPLQPWQRQVADVATELLPDGSWAYRTVVVHVQRQAGKTNLIGPKNLHRTLTRPGCRCWLTAQTRQDGRDTWLDVAELVERSPLGELVHKRRSNGSEALTVPATGSTFRVFAPNEEGLHGKANESVDVDECWAFDAAEGSALEQAILPTFTTTGGQLWLWSTAGTARSAWLDSYVRRGRASVGAGSSSGLAYFEWSLPPGDADQATQLLVDVHQHLADGVDHDDPRVRPQLDAALDLVMAHHPGQFARRDAIEAAALGMSPAAFLRPYGNVWSLTSDQVIPDHLWRAARDTTALGRPLAMPDPGSVSLAFAVAIDRSRSAIGARWTVDGRPCVDVVDERPGDAWLDDRLAQLRDQLAVVEVGYDGAGPALDVADRLDRAGVPLRRLTTVDYAAACAALLQAVLTGQLLHRGTPALTDAVAAAAQRQVGDRWLWARRESAGSIAGLEAVTVASWAYDHRPTPTPAPVIAVRRPTGRVDVVDQAPDRFLTV